MSPPVKRVERALALPARTARRAIPTNLGGWRGCISLSLAPGLSRAEVIPRSQRCFNRFASGWNGAEAKLRQGEIRQLSYVGAAGKLLIFVSKPNSERDSRGVGCGYDP
jgi:hypothetical protein